MSTSSARCRWLRMKPGGSDTQRSASFAPTSSHDDDLQAAIAGTDILPSTCRPLSLGASRFGSRFTCSCVASLENAGGGVDRSDDDMQTALLMSLESASPKVSLQVHACFPPRSYPGIRRWYCACVTVAAAAAKRFKHANDERGTGPRTRASPEAELGNRAVTTASAGCLPLPCMCVRA
jgi:hypothetical protein